MAFSPESNRVPTSIGDISIVITDAASGNDEVTFEVQVLDAVGNIFRLKTGRLIPHLSGASVTKLQEVAAEVRTKSQVLIP